MIASVLACGKDKKNIFSVEIVATLSEARDIEMVSLPGGESSVGSYLYPVVFIDTVNLNPLIIDTAMNVERPVHFIRLSSFQISSTEITQEQYVAVMGVNPSHFSSEVNLPVENVTWYDAADYCNGLSDLLGYSHCYDRDYNCDFSQNGFRLPTETEWEYAARAGTSSEFYEGSDDKNLAVICWYAGNSENRPHRVAGKKPNQAGLYDMSGNVSEWCQDYFKYYNCGLQVDPSGPSSGVRRLTRGGSWADQPKDCRSAARKPLLPTLKFSTVGFRVVRRN